MKFTQQLLLFCASSLIFCGEVPVLVSNHWKSGIVWAQIVEGKQAEGNRLMFQGQEEYMTSQFEAARESWQQALRLYQEINDYYSISFSLAALGTVSLRLGEYEKAIEYNELSLALAKDTGNLLNIASSLDALGNVYERLSDYEKAIGYYQQALVISEEIDNLETTSLIMNNLGNVYESLAEYEKAINYYQQSLAFFMEVDDRYHTSGILINLGNISLSLGNYEESINYYQQSLAISEKIGNRLNTSNALSNLGYAFLSLNKYEEAMDYSQQSLTISEDIGDQLNASNSLNNLGQVSQILENYEQAINYYQRSLAIKKDIGDRSGITDSLNHLGEVFQILKAYKEAIDYYQQSLIVSEEISTRSSTARAYHKLAILINTQQSSSIAIIFHKQSVNYYEQIRKDIKGFSTKDQQTFTNTIEETYLQLADLLFQHNRLLEAQRVLDLLKIQELDDFLEDVEGNQNSQQGIDLLPLEQEIMEGYLAIQGQAVVISSELTELKEVAVGQRSPEQIQEIATLEAEYQAVVDQLTPYLESPETQQTLAQITPEVIEASDRQAIQPLHEDLNNLEQNAALLYTAIFDDRLELLLTTADNLPIRRTVDIDQATLTATIRNFRDALDNPYSDALTPSQELYDLIIRPIEAELAAANVDTLLYAPDAEFRYIPLAALHDGNQWLTEKYQVNHISALALTDFERQSQPQVDVLAGAFANGTYEFELAENNYRFSGLKGAEAEVKRIADTFPSATFIDLDFNTPNTVPQMDNYSIVHLATHAAFVPGKPEESFILFGDGSRTNLREVEQTWNLDNVDLVVLSACETGVNGQFDKGQEILGFGYLMQLAGARASLSSLWEVDDAGTQILMTEFYDQLQANPQMTKLDALQAAQIALINNNETVINKGQRGWGNSSDLQNITETDYAHPYYWSSFILIGNGL